MRKRRNKKQNLNIDYSFAKSDRLEMLNNKSFNLFIVVMVCVRNSCTPSPLIYALTKNPIGSGTTM
jgi:hypothetical protein